MDRTPLVYVEIDGTPCLAGRLWTRARRNQESATFEYARDWLKTPGAEACRGCARVPDPAEGAASRGAHGLPPRRLRVTLRASTAGTPGRRQ
jgi:hypothetical protein